MAKNEHLDRFMAQFPHEALTFDDVSLVTQYADFLPEQANLETRLTRNIKGRSPFFSAAMDTVTEYRTAIAMALMGGVGVIHKNLTIDEQAKQVEILKHFLHGLVTSPISVYLDQPVDQARELLKKHHFSTLVVLDRDGKFAGLITKKDTYFARTPNCLVKDFMDKGVPTFPDGLSLQDAYRTMMDRRLHKLVLVDADNKVKGLYCSDDVMDLVENKRPDCLRDSRNRLVCAAAIGVNDYERAEVLLKKHTDIIVVDSAHGYTKGVIDTVRNLISNFRSRYNFDIVAGNVVSREAASALVEAGVDAVKVGVGPGSICTTRVVCGVGIPQITAIYEAKMGAGEVPVIADGGIKNSGDVPKAIVAGADSVMMGSVLAGTDESPGEKIIHQGRQYVVYRGMGSLSAMKDRGARERYQQVNVREEDLVPQGIEGIVPYAGNLRKVLIQFVGGLRSSMGYQGARTIQELQEKGRFVRVTPAGVAEAHPHDVTITKEAPNYRT
jgi:IMP dehydrogenase